MNPVVVSGALAGAMTVDAAVAGVCEVTESQTTVLGVAVPIAWTSEADAGLFVYASYELPFRKN